MPSASSEEIAPEEIAPEEIALKLVKVLRPVAWTRSGGRPALVPGLSLEAFGEASFGERHGVRFPYMVGAMAHGIASVALVTAMARRGFLACYGAAGLPLAEVAGAIDALQASLGRTPFAVNMIHAPQDTGSEDDLARLLLAKKVHLVEASAYMRLTKALVLYRVKGMHTDAAGRIVAPNRIIAKASRVEVARLFWAPPPPALLAELAASGAITVQEQRLAAQLPMAEDLTVEADSGGHTDNRPLVTLMPQMMALKASLQAQFPSSVQLRLGAAGGLSTPHAVLAAFSMGAAYVVTGTINQACIEAGTSEAVRQLLAQTQQGDITMAPAADMFELGVKVQVLRRGTMFPMQAQKLFELYRRLPSLAELTSDERSQLEQKVFRSSLEAAWESTAAFFAARDPAQLVRAERDPKHKMALLFRSYLGQASHWATSGEKTRTIDYQVWCGPAMPAFNDWVRGSCLEPVAARSAPLVALNLLYHAAVMQRLHWARLQGLELSNAERLLKPKTADELEALLAEGEELGPVSASARR